MITILSGLPRSGKSYFAVNYSNDVFLNPKSSKYHEYQYLYTNIGGFKFDVVNRDLLAYPLEPDKSSFFTDVNPFLVKPDSDFTKVAIYLDWAELYKHLTKLHEMAIADKPDEEMLRYCRYHKLTPSLIIIDEAYRYFTKKTDPVLKWLFGYHGHLGLDLMVIIHRPQLMSADYYGYTETYIDAQPKSKSFSDNTFRYFWYSSAVYSHGSNGTNYDKNKLKAKQEIFDLYKSGDIHKPKKILYKYAAIMIASLLLIALFAFFFMNRMEDRIHPEGSTPPAPTSSPSVSVASTGSVPLSTDLVPLVVRCDQTSCARVDPSYLTRYISRPFFEEIIKQLNLKPLTVQDKTVFNIVYYDFYFMIPSDKLRLFPFWSVPLPNSNGNSQTSISSTPLQGVIQ
jgi:hypothetical protein